MKPYKLIISGDDNFDDYLYLQEVFEAFTKKMDKRPIELVSGMSKGPDALAYMYAHKNNIPCSEFFPGSNQEQAMCKLADGLMLFGANSGKSKAMIVLMHKYDKDVYLIKSIPS